MNELHADNVSVIYDATKDVSDIPAEVEKLGDFRTQEAARNELMRLPVSQMSTLIDNLGNPNQVIQSVLVEIIASKGAAVLPIVLEAMKGDDQSVQGNGISILTHIGEPSFQPLLDAIAGTSTDKAGIFYEAASRFGKHIAHPIKERVERADIVPDSLFLLHVLTEPDAILKNEDRVANLLSSPNQTTVAITMRILKSHPDFAVPIMVGMIGAMNPHLQQNATNVLISAGRPAVPALVEALDHMNQLVQQNAIRALIEIGEPAVEALTDAAWDGSERQQQHAAVVLKASKAKSKKSLFGRFGR